MKLLLAANKRLNTAYYMLKESFGQLWDYQREGWARRFLISGGPRGLRDPEYLRLKILGCMLPEL